MAYITDKKENKAILKAFAAAYGVKIQLNSYQPAVRSFFQSYPCAFGCYISDVRLPTHVQFALRIDNKTKEVSVITCEYILSYGMNRPTFLPLIHVMSLIKAISFNRLGGLRYFQRVCL